jgi:hypothetical protein
MKKPQGKGVGQQTQKWRCCAYRRVASFSTPADHSVEKGRYKETLITKMGHWFGVTRVRTYSNGTIT